MCLSNVTEQYDSPSSLIVDGWKDLAGLWPNLQFQNYAVNGSKDAPLDRWLKADIFSQVAASDGKSYEAGFHVYEDEPNTKRSHRRRVFVRFISAKGDQSSEKVVIAREMYIPSDRNGWPPKSGDPTPPKKSSVLDKAKSILKPGNA